MKGNYDLGYGSFMRVMFRKCSHADEVSLGIECKTDEQIANWLKGKYLLLVQNEKSFI